MLGGEPTLNKNLVEIIEITRSYIPNNNIVLITNGFYIDRHDDIKNVLIDNLRPYNGTIVGIEDINNTGTYCTKFYDIQGREINNIDRLPIGSIYFNNKKSYIKL